jgi:battenin
MIQQPERDGGDDVPYEPVSIDSRRMDDDDGIHRAPLSTHPTTSSYRLYVCFWTLGLLNNASYVIMLAAAKNISEGGTALVFLANILPALIVKGSAPYWFDKVDYKLRLQLATLSMATSFVLVASSSRKEQLVGQLLGVAIGSLQGGLGEASLLALAGKSDAMNRSDDADITGQQTEEDKGSGRCLTCFASGTGFAGVFGYFWKWFWNDWLGLTLSTTLWLAMVLAFSYWSTFHYVMRYHQHQQDEHRLQESQEIQPYHDQAEPIEDEQTVAERTELDQSLSEEGPENELECDDVFDGSTLPSGTPKELVMDISEMTGWQRFQLVMSLWPYIIPLFAVYVAEYALQSGTWTTIGFPVSDMKSRNTFYEYSNWMYQVGVFLSRSSGTLLTVHMAVLWLMPMLQVCNVGLYWFVAASQGEHLDESGIYSPAFLYAAALYTGLLGGAVYCHGYIRICKDLPLRHREFALSATSVAESLGIVVADLCGLVIQACLYQINGLQGAVLTCPFPSK